MDGAADEEVGHVAVPDAESRLPMEGPSSLHCEHLRVVAAVAVAAQTEHIGCEQLLPQGRRRDQYWDPCGTSRGLGLGMPCRRRRSFLPGSSTWLCFSRASKDIVIWWQKVKALNELSGQCSN